MFAVGIDWAEEFHDVALGTPELGVVEQFRIDHGPAGVKRLVARCLASEPDPAEVRVVIETRHGLLVESLLDAGFTLLPVNPDLVARRRGPAKKKDDAEDARICCLLALDRHGALRPLIPHGELSSELRAIARDDERAAKDQLRLLNRLRADLLATFPAAVQLAATCAGDLGSPTMLRLLQRWPTQQDLADASRPELIEFARLARHGWPERFADNVVHAVARPVLIARDGLIRAKSAGIRLAAAQLLALHQARRDWEHRMGELLVGAPRRTSKHDRIARAQDRANDPTRDDHHSVAVVAGGSIYLSFPGLGDRLAARVAGEIGEQIASFEHPNALQCYAGTAPVTRRSGKRDHVVVRRMAYNRHLGDAVHQWAFCSLSLSEWARAFYDTKIAAGHTCHGALRALSNRWVAILWHCLTRGVHYDEAVHQANRARPTAARA